MKLVKKVGKKNEEISLIDNSNTTKIETIIDMFGVNGFPSLIDNSNTTKIETIIDMFGVNGFPSLIDNSNTTKIETVSILKTLHEKYPV